METRCPSHAIDCCSITSKGKKGSGMKLEAFFHSFGGGMQVGRECIACPALFPLPLAPWRAFYYANQGCCYCATQDLIFFLLSLQKPSAFHVTKKGSPPTSRHLRAEEQETKKRENSIVEEEKGRKAISIVLRSQGRSRARGHASERIPLGLSREGRREIQYICATHPNFPPRKSKKMRGSSNRLAPPGQEDRRRGGGGGGGGGGRNHRGRRRDQDSEEEEEEEQEDRRSNDGRGGKGDTNNEKLMVIVSILPPAIWQKKYL